MACRRGIASPGRVEASADRSDPSTDQANPSADQANPSADQLNPSADQPNPSADQPNPSPGQPDPSTQRVDPSRRLVAAPPLRCFTAAARQRGKKRRAMAQARHCDSREGLPRVTGAALRTSSQALLLVLGGCCLDVTQGTSSGTTGGPPPSCLSECVSIAGEICATPTGCDDGGCSGPCNRDGG
jgi:hypothetical protein